MASERGEEKQQVSERRASQSNCKHTSKWPDKRALKADQSRGVPRDIKTVNY